MMEVRYDLKNTQTRLKNIKQIQRINVLAAYESLRDLVLKWGRGYGGDNRKMDDLRNPYKSIKAESGRKPIPNMVYSGNMLAAMSVKRYEDTGAVIYANGKIQNDKLRGNEEKRENLLQLSKDNSLIARLTKLVSAALKK